MRGLLLDSWVDLPVIGLGLLPSLTPRSPICAAYNWWNQDVRSAPRDVDSATIINTIRGYLSPPDAINGRLSTDFGVEYGIPYCAAGINTPLVTVRVDRSPTQSDPGPEGIWTATGPGWKESRYPIPFAAQTNLRYIEGGPVHIGDGDRHLLVLDVYNWILYEFAYAHWQTDSGGNGLLPGKWSAGYVAKWDLKTNDRRPEGWTSTDAAGLAVLPGLIRLDELLDPATTLQPIKHALRFAVPRALATYVYPASHPSSPTPAEPTGQPMGLRLRMKPDVTLAARGITNIYSLKLFRTMQTYGILLADRCGSHNNMIFQGTLDARWNDNGLFDQIATDFHKIFVTDFEVIQRGWFQAGVTPVRKIIISN